MVWYRMYTILYRYVVPKVNMFLIGWHAGCCLEPLVCMVQAQIQTVIGMFALLALKFCDKSGERNG